MPVVIPQDTYLNLVGGTPVNPSSISYETINLNVANIDLSWPITGLQTENVVSTIIDVNSTASGHTITMPDATQVSVGQSVLFRNTSVNTFDVLDFDGGQIASVGDSDAIYIFLTNTGTAAGTWGVVAFGATTADAQASELAGRGLKAISNTLNLNTLTSIISSSTYTVTANDRATLLVWNGGSGTIRFPDFSTLGNGWIVAISNQDPNGGDVVLVPTTGTIDGEGSLTLGLGQTAFFVTDGSTQLFSVGLGNLLFFNASLLSKNIGGVGPTVTISSLEATNLIQILTGTLVEDVTVIYPDTVAQYIISNQTSGSFNVNVVLDGSIESTEIPADQKLFFYSDENDLFSIPSSIAGSSIIFPDGSEGSPSVTFVGDSGSGMYLPAPGNVNISISSSDCVNFSSAGLTIFNDGSTGTPSLAFFNSLSTGLSLDLVNTQLKISTGGVLSASFSANQFLIQNGTVGAPSLSLRTDKTTGFYRPSAGQLAFSSAGVLKINHTATGLKVIDGTNADPAYSFISDTTTGMYYPSPNNLGFTVAGTNVVRMSSNGISVQPSKYIGWLDSGFLLSLQSGTLAANSTYTLPTTIPSISGQPLISSTTGDMSWSSAATFSATGLSTFGGLSNRLYEATNANYFEITAPATPGNYTYVWPANIPVAGQSLKVSSVVGPTVTLEWAV